MYVANDQYKIMLFGKTGVGKSATGNTLAEENVFVSRRAGKWVTEKSDTHTFNYSASSFVIVDTPGLFDSRFENLDFSASSELFVHLVDEFYLALQMCGKGVHTLLICVSGIERCDMLSAALGRALTKIFGASISTNAILCVTRVDDFGTEKEYKEWVNDCKIQVPAFAELITKCSGRVFPIANKPCSWLTDGGRGKILDQVKLLPLYHTKTFEESKAQLFVTVASTAVDVKNESKKEGSGCIAFHQLVKVYQKGEYIYKPISELILGDLVLTTTGFQKYIGDLHNPFIASTLFFVLQNGFTLEVTPDHLLFSKGGYVSAQSLTKRDELLVILDGSFTYVGVCSISQKIATVAAPLTTTGSIVVNDCVVSCFAYAPHSFSKALYWPLFVGLYSDTQKYTSLLQQTYMNLPHVVQGLLPSGISKAFK